MAPSRVAAALACAALAAASSSCASMRGVLADANRVQCFVAPSLPERRRVEGLESTCAAGGIVWIVPARGGVVLVDAGFDESGAQIRAALHGRRVLAILLTHAHIDHRSAAHLFNAPVYVGRDDLRLLEGTGASRAFAAHLADAFGVPPPPKTVIPVDDGFVLSVGGRTFTALALPGHTPGSTGWLLDKLLFSGDALQGPLGDAIYPAPAYVTDDTARAWASMRRLRDVDFDVILDGHFGVTTDAKRKIRAALARADRGVDGTEQPFFRPAGCREGDAVPRR